MERTGEENSGEERSGEERREERRGEERGGGAHRPRLVNGGNPPLATPPPINPGTHPREATL